MTVKSTRVIAQDVVALELAHPQGLLLPAWEPGAHIDLHLPSGLIRQYSLCGSPEDLNTYKIAVLREGDGRGGSVEIHDRFVSGLSVTTSKPRNHFPLIKADSYVFIAGGIGITPILPMIESVSRRGARWQLTYGGRAQKKMAFRDKLSVWDRSVSIVPEDKFGLIDIDKALFGQPSDAPVYCCGPEALILAVKSRCESLGQADRFHFELFGPTASSDGAPTEDTEFEVELVRSGKTLTVPVGTSLLEAVRTVIPDMPSSCETGFCGTCEVRVVHGTPLHRDTIMTDEEKESGETMMICVGRSRTPKLGLDL